MTFAELWLTYQLASRAHLKNSATTQLIELEFQNHKLADLEDVLEHVFRQGFVEPQYRPSTWWEKKDGQKVKASHSVEDLLVQGVGRCPENALKLVVQDVPTALWFTYVYRNNASAPAVVQRVKLAESEAHGRLELLANVTNHIFKEGFLAAKLRPLVHWEAHCGDKIEEHRRIEDILLWGAGTCEEKPLRLIVDAHAPTAHPVHVPECHPPIHHPPVHYSHCHGSPAGHTHSHHGHGHCTYSRCH